MPGRRTHDIGGAVVGLGVGVVKMDRIPADGRWAYVLGGVAGGVLGARLPDLLEPATSSWHRGTCHSLTALAMLGSACAAPPEVVVRHCGALFAHAEGARGTRLAPGCDPRTASNHWWKEMLCYFLLGAIAGAAAGYLSHLVLDARTPRFLPII